MTQRDLAIEDLKSFAAHDYNDDRGQRIKAARTNGLTWREIAGHLGMTENGVHKAWAAYMTASNAKAPPIG